MKGKSKVAVFDFDGTLTTGDSLLPFLYYCFGFWKLTIGILYLSPFIIGYLLKVYPNNLAKKKLVNYFFKNRDVNLLKKIASRFIDEKIDYYIRNNILKRLRWHQKNDHVTILLSASLDLYINYVGGKYNFDHVECSILEIDKHLFTGQIKGDNCYGNEKVKRLKKILGDNLTRYTLYGYGDSNGDKSFLKLCDIKYFKKDLNFI